MKIFHFNGGATTAGMGVGTRDGQDVGTEDEFHSCPGLEVVQEMGDL